MPARLEISRATVARVVGCCGWSRLGRLRAPPVGTARYEHAAPGDLRHVDTKKRGRICGIGHSMPGTAPTGRGSGWEVLHVAADDHSRLAQVQLRADEGRTTVSAFLGRHFAAFGSTASGSAGS